MNKKEMMKWRDCWKNRKKWKNPGLDVIQTFVSLTLVGRFTYSTTRKLLEGFSFQLRNLITIKQSKTHFDLQLIRNDEMTDPYR